MLRPGMQMLFFVPQIGSFVCNSRPGKCKMWPELETLMRFNCGCAFLERRSMDFLLNSFSTNHLYRGFATFLVRDGMSNS